MRFRIGKCGNDLNLWRSQVAVGRTGNYNRPAMSGGEGTTTTWLWQRCVFTSACKTCGRIISACKRGGYLHTIWRTGNDLQCPDASLSQRARHVGVVCSIIMNCLRVQTRWHQAQWKPCGFVETRDAGRGQFHSRIGCGRYISQALTGVK
jgi:hypothetical protein